MSPGTSEHSGGDRGAGRSRSSGSWTLALYGEAGFYMRPDGGSAGRRGDFITSPEVGPLFGAVARPLPRRRVGTDRSARPVHGRRRRRRPRDARPRRCSPPGPPALDAMRYVAVEVSAAQRERHPDRHRVASPISRPVRSTASIIANELLDNLPFRLAVLDGGWREAFVDGRPRRSLRRDAVGTVRPGARRAACHRARSAPAPRSRMRAAAFVDDARRLLRSGTLVVHRLRGAAHRPSSPAARGASGCARTGRTSAAATTSPTRAPRTSPPMWRSTSSPSPTRSGRRRSCCSCRGSTNWSPKGQRDWDRARRATRPRGDADAQPGRARRRRCSIPTGSAASPSPSGGAPDAAQPPDRRTVAIATEAPPLGTSRDAIYHRRHGRSTDGQHDTIDALMAENRRFPPSEEFKDEALVVGHVPVRRGGAGRRGLLGAAGRGPGRLVRAVAHDPRLAAARSPSGSSAASSTCRTTASTGTSPPATATRSRSTGRASPATPARSPTPSCSTRCHASPTCSSRSASARATGSTSTCR